MKKYAIKILIVVALVVLETVFVLFVSQYYSTGTASRTSHEAAYDYSETGSEI